jgi:hypothetical protein
VGPNQAIKRGQIKLTKSVARFRQDAAIHQANVQLKVVAERLVVRNPNLFGGAELIAERLGSDAI